jgi:hypothetical protein
VVPDEWSISASRSVGRWSSYGRGTGCRRELGVGAFFYR